MIYFAPVFEKNKDQFIIVQDQFIGIDEQDAWEIGLGAFVECAIWGCSFTHKVMDVTEGVVGAEAYLGDIPIVIISGPTLENSTKDDILM